MSEVMVFAFPVFETLSLFFMLNTSFSKSNNYPKKFKDMSLRAKDHFWQKCVERVTFPV